MLEHFYDADRALLQRAIQTDRPFHAYIFCHEDSEVLLSSIYAFMSALINGKCTDNFLTEKRLKEGMYPDLLLIQRKTQSVSVDQVRKIGPFLRIRPQEERYRIVLIEQADTMTEVAQNALLKTLEEPSDNAILILAVTDTSALLPTVLSRCALFNLRKTEKKESLTPQERVFIYENLQNIILEGNDEILFKFSEAITRDKMKTESYLHYIAEFFFDAMKKKTSNTAFEAEYDEKVENFSFEMSVSVLDKIYRLVQQAVQAIRGNASQRLCVDALFIRIQEEYHAENSWNQV